MNKVGLEGLVEPHIRCVRSSLMCLECKIQVHSKHHPNNVNYHRLVKILKLASAKNAMCTGQSRELYLGCNVVLKVKRGVEKCFEVFGANCQKLWSNQQQTK